MDGMLSQEEINALLGGGNLSSSDADRVDNSLSPAEIDAIGEISNICMGTAATTLYSLVNQKVVITTPVVSVTNWDELTAEYARPCVFINILYKEGIDGNNLLILKEDDVKIITDLMMGGDGLNPAPELTDLHFSAICEAMNQMMGSSATSLSSMIKKKIDISPPEADLVDMAGHIDTSKLKGFTDKEFVKVTFNMTIGDLVDSTIMQLYPIGLAKELYRMFSGEEEKSAESKAVEVKPPKSEPQSSTQEIPQQNVNTNMNPAMMGMMGQMMQGMNPAMMGMMGQPMMQGMSTQAMGMPADVNVQNVQFQPFTSAINPVLQQENIDLIMDVPLDVSVVLGRTRKSIKEILEFAPGTIIELDNLAGEPINVMVNQKLVAKGEVVVIEENFGIRIKEIIKEKI